MIRISSKKNGFRRCGVAHTKSGAEYPDDRFSAEERARLKADPMLTVEIIPDNKGDEFEAMTVDQLKEAIAKYQPDQPLKGVKKAELIEILKAHKEAAGKE